MNAWIIKVRHIAKMQPWEIVWEEWFDETARKHQPMKPRTLEECLRIYKKQGYDHHVVLAEFHNVVDGTVLPKELL